MPVSPPPEEVEVYKPYDASKQVGKFGRLPPAVDIRAANDPWTRQGQLTPNSFTGDVRSLSPPRDEDFFISSPALEDDLIPSPRPIERPGVYGGFGERNHNLGSENLSVSPVTTPLMKRMDAIAPGPFDTSRSPSSPSFPTRSASFDKSSSDKPPADFLSAPRDPMAPRRSATAPIPIPMPSPTSRSNSFGIPPPSPTIPKRSDYEGFGPPSPRHAELEPKPLALPTRAETFPKPSSPPRTTLPRTPSTPSSRSDYTRPGSSKGHKSKPSMGPVTSRRPPPRTSLLRPQKKSGSVDLAAEFGVQNPYHTPSDSTSSGHSTFSHRSQTSSQTSPARSQARRQPSDSSNKPQAANQAEEDVKDNLRPKDLRIDPSLRPPQRVPSPYDITPGERVDPAIQSGRRSDAPLSTSPYGLSPQDNAFDPAIQSGHLDSAPSPQRTPRRGTRDPAPYRGDCKACGQEIRGKSISSADGRLTGKYHKACFVCTTCSEPFASAEFYVLNDKPYCEQHYHKLNGSLCGSCQKGIEGQYLQDEFQIKYHVGCFRCLDCGQSLSNGYFEVDGRSYCERDAWRRVQQPWFAANDQSMEAHQFMRPPGPPTPRGAPAALAPPGGGRRPSYGMGGGLPARPSPGQRSPGPSGLGPHRPSHGPHPSSSRPRAGPGGPMPRMNKRNTRLGMM
ncbi:hypothetical protein BGZ63DRAFT_216933 [Mariannaea sp. PMI_226]|nr:hypothetical protein BGZ63DRAFT_216933 [Mariannaea sp. PMI_226]